MGFLVACKNEEHPIKTEGARVVSALFIDFSDSRWELTSKSVMESYVNSNSTKLLWSVLLPARMKKGPTKNEGTRMVTKFLPLLLYGDFSTCSSAAHSTVQGPIWPNFKPIRDLMGVLVACKNKEDPIKNKGAKVITKLSISFLRCSRELTP